MVRMLLLVWADLTAQAGSCIKVAAAHCSPGQALALSQCLCCAAQVLLSIRQMEATTGQAAASKVSLLMLGHQAIMDAHLCLLHLTTGAPCPWPPGASRAQQSSMTHRDRAAAEPLYMHIRTCI